jgi:hypothetical protein
MAKKRERGLPAVTQAREDRAAGRYKMTTNVGFAGAAVVVCGIIAYRVMTERELNVGKEDLLKKQRAVATTVGAEWTPLRDKLEDEIVASAGDYKGDFLDPAIFHWGFAREPGLYLRMRVAAAAQGPLNVRKAAADAKKDEFVGCFLREPNDRAARGEADAGAFSDQPWNLGQAYSATRILTDEWVLGVKDAPDKLSLRVFEQQYDQAVSKDIPLAIEVIKRAEFFLLVLDEDAPPALAHTDGGPLTEQALQLVGHPARVMLVDLKSGHEVLRMRRSGEARVLAAGEQAITDPEVVEATQRQVNNCALARRVRGAMDEAAPK